ncbi:MAG: sugar transferase [Acidobacteriota bacterium]
MSHPALAVISRAEPGRVLRPGLPRAVEVVLAAAGLALVSPLLAVASLAVVLDSPGSPFFVHERVGRDGRRYRLWKIRTMKAGIGPEVTAAGDERITRVGRFLRRLKVDELPQLWNVLVGDMSLVGPRPEAPAYVDLRNELWRRILSVRPGITDPVSLALRDEESLLAACGGDREGFYRDLLQPFKLRGYESYLEERTAGSDLRVILETALVAVRLLRRPAVTLEDVRGEPRKPDSPP